MAKHEPTLGERGQGAVAGAIAGASIAAVLGQVPPLTVLPEETVTIPVGTILGFIIGALRPDQFGD